uniref:Uncharacterized protein n=1 Tax=Hydrodictyon reticulatum TaxID=3107 RepID=A0A1W6F7Q2_HYDRE|nr:hypothetical protein [Hydrodictyon reticulatum]ARK36686.1 hypothetical protein [Hydrodictyon reticulatum]
MLPLTASLPVALLFCFSFLALPFFALPLWRRLCRSEGIGSAEAKASAPPKRRHRLRRSEGIGGAEVEAKKGRAKKEQLQSEGAAAKRRSSCKAKERLQIELVEKQPRYQESGGQRTHYT